MVSKLLILAAFAAGGAQAACVTAGGTMCGTTYAAAKAAAPKDVCAGLSTYATCVGNWFATCTPTEAALAHNVLIKKTMDTLKTANTVLCGATVTTTLTPWDSSASSDSGTSLDSLYSSSFKTDSSSASIGKSSSGSSSGSTASGSYGSFMQIWQWLLLLACCCLCIGGGAGAAAGGKKKPKKKVTKKPSPASPAPVATPEAVLEQPLFSLQPLQTTSSLVPSYSMVATPQYAPQMAYAAPVTTAYAAPATTAYAQPAYAQQYAAPATTAYAQPAYAQQYAAPATTAYSTGVGGYGGYPMGTVSGYNAGGVV